MLKHQLFQRLFSADALDVRNEVWAWDIPAIVRTEVDDELAQDLIIAVCSSPHVWTVATHRTLFFRFLVARGRARKPFKTEGYRRPPVL